MDAITTQGLQVPKLGLGTFRLQGDECRAAVATALAMGYRHIDTAEMYANEDAVGDAVAAVGHSARANFTSPQKCGGRIWRLTRSAAPSTAASPS